MKVVSGRFQADDLIMRSSPKEAGCSRAVKKILVFVVVLLVVACSTSISPSTSPAPKDTNTQPASPTLTRELVHPTSTVLPTQTPTTVASLVPWWDDAVFYEIFVRSFYDSNGDGIGDFNGLTEKLDYLNDGDPNTTDDLGISALWLMPIHPSPSTHGYDVTDYYAVNPQYGTMDDFRRLVLEAHHRGMRVIIDLVLNHTSSQHPWFIQSQDPDSPYRNWYVWKKNDPGFRGPWNQQVWYPLNGEYFYSFFWQGMPDLNYTNSEVTTEMENVARFWLEDVGIDGFRLDAIGSLIEYGTQTIQTAATHNWLARFYRFYKAINPEAMTVGELWYPDDVVISYVKNEEVDLAFEFDLAAAMIASVNAGGDKPVSKRGVRHFPNQSRHGTRDDAAGRRRRESKGRRLALPFDAGCSFHLLR
jgi:alpha-amylase